MSDLDRRAHSARLSARVTRTKSFSALHNVYNIIPFDVSEHDVGGFYAPARPDRLTIPVSGAYLIGANVRFARNALGVRSVSIVSDELGLVAQSMHPASPAVMDLHVSVVVALTEGSTVRCEVYQNSGDALFVVAFPSFSPVFWIAGPL